MGGATTVTTFAIASLGRPEGDRRARCRHPRRYPRAARRGSVTTSRSPQGGAGAAAVLFRLAVTKSVMTGFQKSYRPKGTNSRWSALPWRALDVGHLLLVAAPEESSEWKHPKVYCLQKSPQELGKMIDSGPRNVLGIIRNRDCFLLEEHLQICAQLR